MNGSGLMLVALVLASAAVLAGQWRDDFVGR